MSVTQQFNTTTSMGRLTLNVLLSFAQFEWEVAGERIRDKFATSRRKGMWMGGTVPLGYRVKDRKLVVDAPETDIRRRRAEAYRNNAVLNPCRGFRGSAQDRGQQGRGTEKITRA